MEEEEEELMAGQSEAAQADFDMLRPLPSCLGLAAPNLSSWSTGQPTRNSNGSQLQDRGVRHTYLDMYSTYWT